MEEKERNKSEVIGFTRPISFNKTKILDMISSPRVKFNLKLYSSFPNLTLIGIELLIVI